MKLFRHVTKLAASNDLELRVEKLEKLVDVLCLMYVKQHKEEIDKHRSHSYAGYYYGEDREIVQRADVVSAKQEYNDAAYKLRRALEKL